MCEQKKEDSIKAYWEGEADVYDDGIKEELNSPFCQAWTDLVLGNGPGRENMQILDVGTGPGFFPVVLGRLGHHVTGIDITENMITCAKENVNRYKVSAELETMDSHQLRFADHTFDMVICRNVTWTLEDPEKAYVEWKRVLKPGGTLLVFDACWYLHLFDEELAKVYRENEERIREKYHRGIHQHNDADTGDELSRKLFMSDKVRPAWDLAYFLKIGFSKVFAEKDITDLVWADFNKELNGPTPQFMVGAIK